MTHDTTRAFIALPLPESIGALCAETQRTLKQRRPKDSWGVRFTRADQLHVTLKYLGDLSSEHVDAARALLPSVAKHGSGITGETQGLGAFSSPRRAHVVVLHLTSSPGLETLVQELEAAATQWGVAAESRRYRAHVTLARLKRPSPIGSWLDGVDVPKLTSRFDELRLYRSDLLPSGANYTMLASAPLE